MNLQVPFMQWTVNACLDGFAAVSTDRIMAKRLLGLLHLLAMPVLRYRGEADNNGACIAHQDKHHAQVHKARVRPEFRPWSGRHRDGVAAVKVQYPGALAVMLQDLANIRLAAAFLQVCIASL